MKISRMFWSSSTKLMTSSRTRKYMHLKSPKTLGHHPFPWQDGDDEGTQAMMGWWWDRTIFSAYDSADRFGFGRLAPFWTSCRRVACPILKHCQHRGHATDRVPCNQGWHFSALPGLEGLMKWQEGGKKCVQFEAAREAPFRIFTPTSGVFFVWGEKKLPGTPSMAFRGTCGMIASWSMELLSAWAMPKAAGLNGDTVTRWNFPCRKNTPGSSNIAGWKMDPEWVDVFPI